MTLKQLQELRAGKIAQMGEIQAKGDTIVATDLATMKTLQEEIGDVDMQIEAIELTRKYAMNNTKKPEEKKDDFVAVQTESFKALLKGSITADRHEQNIRAAVGSYDVAAGKELVPDEFVRILKERVSEYGMIIPDLDIIQTENHGILSYPTMDDTANVALWLDEHGDIDLSDFATGKIDLNAFKCGTGVVISNELIEDSFFDILVYSANLLGIRIGRTLEAGVINGDGIKKPLGILNTILITGTVKAIVNVDTITTLEIVPDDLEAMIDALPPSQRIGAKFYASDIGLRTSSKWKDTTGRKILQVSSEATDAKPVVYSFGGYPIILNNELGALAVGDNPFVFGNPKNYTLRLVRPVTVKASDQVKIVSDETVIVGTARADGRMTSINECFVKLSIKA